MVVVVNRFDKEESITIDWLKDALIPAGRYQLEDLWSGTQHGMVVVGGEVWDAAQWKGILRAHDNWCFKLSPML